MTAIRTLPGEIYLPGELLFISIAVSGDPGSITVVESPPAGWTIYVSGNGQLTDGIITWNVESFSGNWTLKYSVKPPRDATGEGLFTGRVGDQEIGGMSRMAGYEIPAEVHLPQTTGSYAVSTILARLVDESRGEQFTPRDPDDQRELMVQVYYPADVSEGQSPGLVYPGFELVQSILKRLGPLFPYYGMLCPCLRGMRFGTLL